MNFEQLSTVAQWLSFWAADKADVPFTALCLRHNDYGRESRTAFCVLHYKPK